MSEARRTNANIVAIETATETVGVAVRTAAGVEADFTLTGRRRHVETLTPALEHLLDRVDLTPEQIDAVAVDIGPGLFTGLRVGVAAAKGLAQSLGLGVLGFTSLEILGAAAARSAVRGIVVACVDARRGEVFASASELDASGSVKAEVVAAGLFTPADLAEALRGLGGGTPVHAVGDGALRYADVLGAVDGVDVSAPALSFPPPATLLTLAQGQLEEGRPPVEPGSVVPLYMREADAKSNFAQAERS
jgi:tRNA threonylcarbamoyladenosine biosynthesis protein TsaB